MTEIRDRAKALYDDCSLIEAAQIAVQFYEGVLEEYIKGVTDQAKIVAQKRGTPETDTYAKALTRLEIHNRESDWPSDGKRLRDAFRDLTIGNPVSLEEEEDYSSRLDNLALKLEDSQQAEATSESANVELEREIELLQSAVAERDSEISDLIDEREELRDQIKRIKIAVRDLEIGTNA